MNTSTLERESPLTEFSSCHAGIVAQLTTFAELPALVAPLVRAREVAEQTLAFFHTVYDHHVEEEKDLFPLVLAHAAPGDERDRVAGLVKALTDEHRDIEALWMGLEPALRHFADGQLQAIDGEAVAYLVRKYTAHARFEETEFLPLSKAILGRQGEDLAALGLALHTRHVVRAARRGLIGS